MADSKIVAEYTVKVDKALKDLNKLAARVDKVDDERKKVQKGFKEMSTGLSSTFKKLGGMIAATFAVDRIVDFTAETIKLAASAEGVERAFRRIGGANSANLLSGLRNATRGTVSDLQLMQKAVQASNFKIPLESLASLFQFAQARARETGESVEYLTNSIVLGIGRKSPLILDNLGISAVELRKRLKGVGVEAANVGDIAAIIGEIAQEELAKMGDQADTTADKIEQISAAFENMKVVIGTELIGEIDNLTEDFSGLTEQLERLFETDSAEVWSKALRFGLRSLTTGFRVAGAVIERTLLIVNGVKDGIEELFNMAKQDLEEAGILYQVQEQSEEAERSIKGLNSAIASVYKMIKNGSEEETSIIKNLAYYNSLIKELRAEQEAANTTRERVRELEDEINEAIRQRLILLGKLRVVGSGDEERLDLVRSTAARMTDAEFDAAKNSLVIQQQLTDDILADYERRNGEIEKAIEARNEIEARLAEERAQQQRSINLAIFNEAINTISSVVDSIGQIQRNAFLAEQQELEKQLEEGLLTREEYERKANEIRRKEAQANKDIALFQAIISTAQAVTNALATPNVPFPVAAGFAALAGVQGAVQIAAIASQPLPQFAEGGFVNEHGEIKGKKHKQGGVKIEAEGGEFITSAKHAKQNADILKAINSGQWEKYKMENIIAPAINQVLEGGFENMGASYMLNTNWTDKNLLRQGDRNRYAMRDGFMYLGKEIRSLKENRNRWN